jgi:hypothetical protein
MQHALNSYLSIMYSEKAVHANKQRQVTTISIQLFHTILKLKFVLAEHQLLLTYSVA